jgi:very-short-patch-repair endonuclease
MSTQSINLTLLGGLHTAQDVHDLFGRLGYPVAQPDAFTGDDLDALDLDPADRANVVRAYIVAQLHTHTVYLYEVYDLRTARLRSLAWNVLQRGTGLLIVTTPAERGEYREILFVDPRFAGKPIKSAVRVNKLKVVTAEPTRHDLDTLNAIHAHRRTGQQVYDAQGAAFNVTTVTKRFYEEYRGHYERAKAAIQKANPGVRDFYDADKLHAFTQRLLGRLMFLYFLQRKGWLGGRARFLTERYIALQRQHADEIHDGETYYYYRDVLEPLFFRTLNENRPGNITQWEGIRIPYLNGGLFDNTRDPAGPILIPDSLFDPNDVTGLLGFFNRYNFTIADDTPLEQDVAVDPEMLGKVFENLLEERDRGQSGSFYTPRSIVAYMCQEALAGYLEESTKDANGISIPRETTRALFDPDADAHLTPDQAARMNAALDTLTVLDPAVGSGSFLIGMLNEILRLRRAAYAALHPDVPEPDAQTFANWKEAIIRDTLYGVDIKPEAIEIAQLRLWLALIVDQTLEQARPLPNLDYKLMAGDSLIETLDGEPVLTESAAALLGADVTSLQPGLGLFETDRERQKLDELRRAYFSASPKERKRLKPDILNQERRIIATALREKAEAQEQIINQIGKLAAGMGGKLKTSNERKLKAATEKLARLTALQEALDKPDYAPPFFLYRLHFSEVFEKKGGFDIVVANPPYVRGELLGAVKDEFKVTPIYQDVYAGTADLYVYFYARGYHLLRPGGQLAYITSNKYLRANYGRGLRKFLAEKLTLRALIDFGDLPVFEAAAYPCIVIGEKALTPGPSPSGRVALTPGPSPSGRVALTPGPSPSGRGEGELAPNSPPSGRGEGELVANFSFTGEGIEMQRGERPPQDEGAEARDTARYREMASRTMVQIARDLRQRETSAEEVLWECLRDRRLANLKFRRQHPVAQTAYVVDFFCYEYRLAIELDGAVHAQQVEADRARQQALEALGLRVLRFPNEMVFRDLTSVLTTILQTALTSPLAPLPEAKEPGTHLASPLPEGEGSGVRAILPEGEGSGVRAILPEGEGSGVRAILPEREGSGVRAILPEGEGSGVMAILPEGEGSGVRAILPEGEGSGVRAISITRMDDLENLPAALANGVTLRQADLGEGEWQISDAATQRVFAKIKAAGVPLGEYVGGKIYYGIKTGLNEAFVIDAAKRAELIAADPKSAEIIKPWLRGRDIKRWRVEWSGLYLIAVQNSGDADANNAWANAKTESEARAIFKATYPAVHDHLTQYEDALRVRQDQGRWWWELRACAYYTEFEKPKIVFPDIAPLPQFAFDTMNAYLGNTAYIIPIDDQALLAYLNSPVTHYFYSNLSTQIRGGYFRFIHQYVSQLPIPTPPAELRERIAALARACQEAALTPGPSPRGEGSKAWGVGGGPGMKAASANAQHLSAGKPGVSISSPLPEAKEPGTYLPPPLPEGEGPGVRAILPEGEGSGVRATSPEGEGPGVRATSPERQRPGVSISSPLPEAKEPGTYLPPPLPEGEGPGVRALEAELNALVYQAYGLDEDDIRVIESAVGGKREVESTAEADESEERS